MPRIPIDNRIYAPDAARVGNVRLPTGVNREAVATARAANQIQTGLDKLGNAHLQGLENQFQTDMIAGESMANSLKAKRDAEIKSIPVKGNIDYQKEVDQINHKYDTEWRGWTEKNIRNRDYDRVENMRKTAVKSFEEDGKQFGNTYGVKYEKDRDINRIELAEGINITDLDNNPYDEVSLLSLKNAQHARVELGVQTEAEAQANILAIDKRVEKARKEHDLKIYNAELDMAQTKGDVSKVKELINANPYLIPEQKEAKVFQINHGIAKNYAETYLADTIQSMAYAESIGLNGATASGIKFNDEFIKQGGYDQNGRFTTRDVLEYMVANPSEVVSNNADMMDYIGPDMLRNMAQNQLYKHDQEQWDKAGDLFDKISKNQEVTEEEWMSIDLQPEQTSAVMKQLANHMVTVDERVSESQTREDYNNAMEVEDFRDILYKASKMRLETNGLLNTSDIVGLLEDVAELDDENVTNAAKARLQSILSDMARPDGYVSFTRRNGGNKEYKEPTEDQIAFAAEIDEIANNATRLGINVEDMRQEAYKSIHDLWKPDASSESEIILMKESIKEPLLIQMELIQQSNYMDASDDGLVTADDFNSRVVVDPEELEAESAKLKEARENYLKEEQQKQLDAEYKASPEYKRKKRDEVTALLKKLSDQRRNRIKKITQ